MSGRRRAPGLVNPNDNDDSKAKEFVDARGAELIARNIEYISKAMEAVNGTRLTRKAIIALIHDQSGVAKKTIEIVLNNLSSLGNDWLKRATP